MDKYELRILSWTGLLLTVFMVSVLYSAKYRGLDLPACVPYDGTYKNAKIEKLDENLYQIYYVAQMWGYEPYEVYLPVGSEVDIFLTSKDVVHGFHIAEKGLNMMAVPGAINQSTVKFDKPGVYEIVCHEYCGTGHQFMVGEIIVNYPEF